MSDPGSGEPLPPPHDREGDWPDPIATFGEIFAAARQEAGEPATAVLLATADADGRPSARVVLLKQVDRRGFVVYTNRTSRKAEQLAANPRAALTAYWPALGRQIRVEGAVERVADEEADAYFATRSRESQLGAWASRQSAALPARALLLERTAEAERRFAGGPVPRPPFWGGYRILPERIEFWLDRAHRLHDRVLYRRAPDGAPGGDGRWEVERLYP